MFCELSTDERSALLTRAMSTEEPGGERRDGRSLEEVFTAEEGPLLRFAATLTGRRETAEEIVQESFLRLHNRWGEVRSPRPWLYRCARNLALNSSRDSSREIFPETGIDGAAPGEGPLAMVAKTEAAERLREAVAALPQQDRELLALRYDEGLTYAEVAARTGLGIGNVGFRLHHILKSLAATLRAAGLESAEG